VDDLKEVDPAVLEFFHSKVPPADIANRGEPFNSTDVVVKNRPGRRFVLPGGAPGLWFILYEHGGIAYHHDLVVFSKSGHCKVAAVAQRIVKGDDNFESLKRAIEAGQFFSQSGNLQF
jgi:hypothetical protein